MSYLMAAVLGIIQGVAEFLPISSSGHLTLFQHFFGMPEPDNLFNVLLHFATLIAVFIYYWSDIWEMITEFFLGLRALFVPRYRSQGEPPAARRLILLIIVATLPLFLVLPIKDYVEQIGNYPAAVSCILLLTGAVLFLSDRMAHGHKNARSATLKDALLGMAFAGVVGYFSIGLVNLLTAKGKFGAFAYYCWGAGALFLVLSLTGFTLVPAA